MGVRDLQWRKADGCPRRCCRVAIALELLSRPVHELGGGRSGAGSEIDRYHYLGYTPLAGAQLRYYGSAWVF